MSIVCTQPRRVAAITVAERVAFERGEQLGSSVGYQVKMDSRLPRKQVGKAARGRFYLTFFFKIMDEYITFIAFIRFYSVFYSFFCTDLTFCILAQMQDLIFVISVHAIITEILIRINNSFYY